MHQQDSEKQKYVARILQFYLQLPHTPTRFSRLDRTLAEQLYDQRTSAEDLETAMLLACARRFSKDPDASLLGPIRSLHYFLPVLREIQKFPLPPGYLSYLRSILNRPNPLSR